MSGKEAHFTTDYTGHGRRTRTTYHGYVVDMDGGPQVIWQCGHEHKTADTALECSRKHLRTLIKESGEK